MSEERSQYSSTILISKTPSEAAEIVDHRLSSAHKLNSEFVSWFQEYATCTSDHNSKLQQLLKRGADINQRVSSGKLQDPKSGELGSLVPLWNSILSSLNTEINGNDIFVKNIRKDSINQLKNFIERDVRWAEMTDYKNELIDIAQHLNRDHKERNQSQDYEFKWNAKAPQYFDTLETVDYVRVNLIKDVFLKFQSNLSDKATHLLKTTEKSTASILDFSPQDEIIRFSEFIASVPSAPPRVSTGSSIPSLPEPPFMGRRRGASHSTVQSYGSFDSSNDPDDSKKKSRNKLRSKVGSIFGKRKSKNKLAPTNYAIPEGSQSPPPSEFSETFSRVPTDSSNVDNFMSNQTGANSATGNAINTRTNINSPGNQQTSFPVSSKGLPPNPQSNPNQIAFGLNSVNTSSQYNSIRPLNPSQNTPEVNGTNYNKAGSPNIERFTHSSSEEDAENFTPSESNVGSGRTQESPLSKAPLNAPQESPISQSTPPTAFPDLEPSSVYHQQEPTIKLVNDRNQKVGLGIGERESVYPDPDISGISPDLARLSYAESTVSTEHKKPAPPPSRKSTIIENPQKNSEQYTSNSRVGYLPPISPTIDENGSEFEKPLPRINSNGSGPRAGPRRKDIQSQLFTNLPQARDSVFITKPSPSFPRINASNDSRSLISQNTGNTLSISNNGTFSHAELNDNGLSVSVSEIVNAVFKNGDLTKSQTIGEIVFNYKESTLPQQIRFKISNLDKSSKLLVNNQFIKQCGPDEYLLDPQLIFMRPLGGIKYMLNRPIVPMIIQQVWRYEPHQASLMISLKLSPEIVAKNLAITFTNFVVSVAIDGVETSSASSRPSGTFNKEKSRISWRYPSPLVLSPEKEEERLIARFMTNGIAKEHQSGVQLQFNVDTSNISLDDDIRIVSFNDQNKPIDVTMYKNLISGVYSGHY